jgi:hypothetical protein
VPRNSGLSAVILSGFDLVWGGWTDGQIVIDLLIRGYGLAAESRVFFAGWDER